MYNICEGAGQRGKDGRKGEGARLGRRINVTSNATIAREGRARWARHGKEGEVSWELGSRRNCFSSLQYC